MPDSGFPERRATPPAMDHMRQFLRDQSKDHPPAPVTADLLLGLFNEALGQDDPKPSLSYLTAMAAEINGITERPGGGRDPIRRERALRFLSLWDAAIGLRAAYAAYLEINTSPSPANQTFDVFSSVDEQLRGEGVGDVKHEAAQKLGHPKEDHWHPIGHAFAALIVTAMESVGYSATGRGRGGLRRKRTLDKTNADSVTAQVGAALIRHIFRLPDGKPSPLGFASAMQHRDRSKKPDFSSDFDGARVLD